MVMLLLLLQHKQTSIQMCHVKRLPRGCMLHWESSSNPRCRGDRHGTNHGPTPGHTPRTHKGRGCPGGQAKGTTPTHKVITIASPNLPWPQRQRGNYLEVCRVCVGADHWAWRTQCQMTSLGACGG